MRGLSFLNNLQCDINLRLPWQQNYRISCTWNQEGKHFVTIKNQFLAFSIAQPVPGQLAKIKGQYTLQSRSITWISIQTPQNLNTNSIFNISLDRQLPTGIIPLDVLHNINNKQPRELVIPLLNVANTDIKLTKNTVLGSLTRVSNIDSTKMSLTRRCSPPVTRHVMKHFNNCKYNLYFQSSQNNLASKLMHMMITNHQ